MRSPGEFFIKYLLVHPDAHTDDAVLAELKDGELDAVEPGYLARLRARLAPPSPFYPRDARHTRSQRFLVKEEIRALFHPDDDVRAARRIWKAPRAREFAETMLLLYAPAGAIADAITRRGAIRCTAAGIHHFRHFFWNVDLLDATQMRTFVAWRTERLADDESKAALARATKRATDPRRIAADLPFSPLAAILAQMRLGLLPPRTPLAERVTAAAELATLRAEEALWGNSPSDAARARDFATTARIFHDMLATLATPMDELREQLRQISLRSDPARLPTVHALSGGNHTADLQPVERSDDDDD